MTPISEHSLPHAFWLCADRRLQFVQFLDFEQIPFDDGENTYSIHIEPDELYARELTLPNVDQESNYQVVAIHSPFAPTREDFDSLFLFGTYRVVVSP